jgi:regulator of protease activity HflC (stomatin/prohibitin superfamily)
LSTFETYERLLKVTYHIQLKKISDMILTILGIFILIASFNKAATFNPKISSLMRAAGFILAVVGLLATCFTQINAGRVGVKSLFGKVQNDILPSGLHIINPLMDVTEVDVKTQNYTMSGIHDEGDKQGDDAIKVLTADGLEVTIDLTVLYRVIPESAPKIISQIGADYQQKIVRPISRTKIRDNAVYYDAVALYSSKRDEFQKKIFESIKSDFLNRGLELEQLLVRNISLPASVKSVIEQKINAEQESQKMQFVLLKEKQEADRKRLEAQGIADYQKIINTGLTDKQLKYEMIKAYQDLVKSPNAKVILMGNGDTPVILGDK